MKVDSNSLKNNIITIGWIVIILLSLDCFFVSIKLLGIFKSIGANWGQEMMVSLAQNPFVGLVLGMLTTSIIQSSSTTTSLVVALVAGGVFGEDPAQALQLAIPIIMGANIGTSVTNTIVSMSHVGNPIEFQRAFSASIVHDFFNLLTVVIFIPLQIATNFLGKISLFLANIFETFGGLKFVSPLKYLIKPQIEMIHGIFEHDVIIAFVILFFFIFVFFFMISTIIRRTLKGYPTFYQLIFFPAVLAIFLCFGYFKALVIFSKELAVFLFALGVLFTSLYFISTGMKTVVISRITILFDRYIFKTTARAFILGIIITAIVQSSSITTSILVPLAGAGILTLYQIYPYTLGANIGTTITAMLAALALGETVAIAVAFAHLTFNICGISIFLPLKRLPIAMAGGFAKLAARSPVYPIAYIVIIFILIPILFIIAYH
jgi:sodium-dependent phosphate cotransporter